MQDNLPASWGIVVNKQLRSDLSATIALHDGERTSQLYIKKFFNLGTMASPSNKGIKIIARLTVSLLTVYHNIVSSKHCFGRRKDRSITRLYSSRDGALLPTC